MRKAQPRRRRRSHWSEHSGWIGRSPRPSSGRRSDYSGTCSETQQKGCWREWICHHWFESRRPRCVARPQMLLWSGYSRWCWFLPTDCPARLCGQTAFWRAAMLLSSHRPSRYTAREPSTLWQPRAPPPGPCPLQRPRCLSVAQHAPNGRRSHCLQKEESSHPKSTPLWLGHMLAPRQADSLPPAISTQRPGSRQLTE